MPRCALLLAAPWLLALAGCGKPQAGQACTKGEAACTDEHLGLFCSADHFVTMTCMGPAGCQKVGRDDVTCDNPVAKIGDGCNQENDAACTEDRANALVCKAGKFALREPCRGPRGCTSLGETVSCDHVFAEPGDPCTLEGESACRLDHSSFLKCQKRRFQITNGCRGPKECTVIEKPDENKEHFECDDSTTLPGDPCEDEGEESCSLDKKSVDVCKAHRIVASKACPGPTGCVFKAKTSHFDCDAKKK
jgi:hypothetical protein